MKTMKRSALDLRTAIALGLLALAGHAAAAWPDHVIKLIAPSTAGGPPDVYARAVAQYLGKELGQAVIVENMPAAGGMIAAQSVMHAAADGYTLLVSTAGMMTITPNANPRAHYKPADFAPICQGVEANLVLASNPSLGTHDFNELQTWIKAQKTPPTYSSYSAGSPAHFLGYQLSEALHVPMTHVPYKSSPQQINDMLGNAAPLGFVQIATAGPQIKAGKLVAYATTGTNRSPQLPNVPTVAELGFPQLQASVWFGLVGPKDLSPAIVERLTQAHQKMLASPDFDKAMQTAGLSPTPGICGTAYLRTMDAESQRWTSVIKATGFVAD